MKPAHKEVERRKQRDEKNISSRVMRQNIWRALLSATDQEIRDGMDFYPGANGLCRLFSRIHNDVSTEQVAGIYAALSPMNGWYTNVANVLDVLRQGERASVNTSQANKNKAVRIRSGESPLDVLRGRKVIAFYKGISNPDDVDPIPVDRHLICLALGEKLGNPELSKLAADHDLYSKIESVYQDLGRRERIGNRLASIAWFVQRRISQNQTLMFQPSSPVCCDRMMLSHGTKVRRFRCGNCGRTRVAEVKLRSAKVLEVVDGHSVSVDSRGRKRIYLGVGHEFSNSGGWQYLSRYLVMREVKRKLGSDEHVHHKNLVKDDDDLSLNNYRVLLAESHGRYHSYIAELAGGRGPDGRFREYDVPIDLIENAREEDYGCV